MNEDFPGCDNAMGCGGGGVVVLNQMTPGDGVILRCHKPKKIK